MKSGRKRIFYLGCIIVILLYVVSNFTKGVSVYIRLYYGETHQEGRAQLFYWNSGEQLSEKKSSIVTLNGNSAVEFNVGRINDRNMHFRVDPIDIQEDFSVERMELYCSGQKILDLSGQAFMNEVSEVFDCDWYVEGDRTYFFPSNTDPRMTISIPINNPYKRVSDIIYFLTAILFMMLAIIFAIYIYPNEKDYKWEKLCGGLLISIIGSRVLLEYLRIPFYGLGWITLAGVIFYIYYMNKEPNRAGVKVGSVIYALIFSLGLVMGYHIQTNFNLYFGTKLENYISKYSVEDVWAFSFLVLVVLILLNGIVHLVEKQTIHFRRIQDVEIKNRRIWLMVSAIIFIAWLPYLMTYYPGMILGDSLNSIYQAVGQVGWNNHHPLAYSFFIKICLEIGTAIKDINLGCCIYTLVQMGYVSCCLGYVIYWLWCKGIPKKMACILTGFYAFSPFFALNGIVMWKYPIFSASICVWTLVIFDFLTSHEMILDKKFYLKNMFFILVICFVRNNGIYIIAFVELVLILTMILKRKEGIIKKLKKPIIGMGIVFLMILVITGPLYNKLGVSGEPVESIGIFLNQMASVAAYDGNMSENDREFMNNLLPLDRYAEVYRPCVVDRLKWDAEFNQTYLNEHIDKFWKTYFSMLIKNPMRYIKAWELNTFGYWAVNFWEFNFNRQNITAGDLTCIYTWDNCGIVPKNFLYGWSENAEETFPLDDAMPALSYMSWFILLCYVYVFARKKMVYGVALAPSAGLVITLLIGTPHAYWQRYGLACYYLLPFYVFLFILLMHKDDTN